MAKILVADDEEGVRSFIAEALEREGHQVLTARDGLEASKLLEQQGVDLLVTDLKMPRLDGMALLAKVREEQPDVEVIVLTAFGTIESAVAAMRAGAFDYLTKPIGSPAELRLVAARALERRMLKTFREQALPHGEVRLSFGAKAMEPVVTALRKVAPTPATVLLTGESGTGKEVAARALHRWSPRAQGPFVAINCAALSESLLESELFGHEKGAFTGAVAQRRGRIELADGGTFFLDEVGELKAELQAKLLRVLQERKFERVGGTRTLEADVRWVAATNRDLQPMIAAGTFREDLYHRLAVFPIRLPALRERPEDLAPLSQALLEEIGRELGRAHLALAPDAAEAIARAALAGEHPRAAQRARAGGDPRRRPDDPRRAPAPRARPSLLSLGPAAEPEPRAPRAARDRTGAPGGRREPPRRGREARPRRPHPLREAAQVRPRVGA